MSLTSATSGFLLDDHIACFEAQCSYSQTATRPHHNPANLVIALAGFRPATAEHAQISSWRLKSSDSSSCQTRSAAHSPAASPSANLLGRLDPDHKSLPRLSNRHSACGTALRSLKRGSLPWRLSDAGRRTRGAVHHAAGIRNSSQLRPTFAAQRSDAICQFASFSAAGRLFDLR